MLEANKLKNKANYLWRVGATGFSFASFGIGGAAIGGVISPIVKMTTQDDKLRKHRTQQLIKHSFKGFTEMMVKLGIMTYEIEGLEKLKNSKNELVIANHPTLIDVVVLIGLMEKANCVVKQALWSNPFTRGPVQGAGYILNAGSDQFIQDCVGSFSDPSSPSLVIFPEGTRTAKNEVLNEFQRGAANIALRANVPVRPVMITCTPSTLTKNEKWYHIPAKPFHVKVKVLDAFKITDVLEDVSISPKNVRLLNHHFHQFFYQELSKNEQSC
jgi:1-acyl-sn-glycerol-3-phosphate acyltransferase